jgi:hypothetical protein
MTESDCYSYDFNHIFSLETNIPYFEGMLHAFSSGAENSGADQEADGNNHFRFKVILDNNLNVSTSGKERVNLMLLHKPGSRTIEFTYPWFKPIFAKLDFGKQGFTFAFNKRYLTFSNIVAEGWELIDVFRSMLEIYLIQSGMYMFHAAAIKLRDEGILIPAFGNTGKTTTSWMLSKNRAEFLTDEFAIIDSRGCCFGLPCSSVVSKGSVTKFGLSLSRRQSLALYFNELKSKILSTRFAPGGIKIYPDNLFRICNSSKISRIVIIQNGSDLVQKLTSSDTLMRIKAIQDYEFGWKANPYVLALSFFGGLDLNSLIVKEYEFLRNFTKLIQDEYVVSSSSGEHYKSVMNIVNEIRSQRKVN